MCGRMGQCRVARHAVGPPCAWRASERMAGNGSRASAQLPRRMHARKPEVLPLTCRLMSTSSKSSCFASMATQTRSLYGHHPFLSLNRVRPVGRSPVPESESPTTTRSGTGPASARSSSQVLSPPASARQRGSRTRTRPDRQGHEGRRPPPPDNTPQATCREGWNAADRASDPSRKAVARSQRREG